ncbi:hypothetical protein QOZ80_5AG0375720 [Eleusine coracana subsp. coracana]|nr:hypothetical protein QOZ80_5AG0375720 [Eleusine coracana subsp. coracana]
MEGERDVVHVVDLGGGAGPRHLVQLLCLFAAHPGAGGAPRLLRLTVVSDLHDGILSCVEKVVTQEAVRLQINHQVVFNTVRSNIHRLSAANIVALGTGHHQALAIMSSLQLHRLIADVITVQMPAAADQAHDDGNKKGKRKLPAPSDHNGADLRDHVSNSFDYYAAFVLRPGGLRRRVGAAPPLGGAGTAPRRDPGHRGPRRRGAQGALREDGFSWPPRMRGAGYEPAHVSFDVYREAARLALQLSGKDHDDGPFFFYSGMTPIFSLSVWQLPRSTHQSK